MDSKPSPLRVVMRGGATLFATLVACLLMAGTSLAGVNTSTVSPQNVTSSGAALGGQGTCLSGQTCTVFFHYKSLTAGSWQTTPAIQLSCTSSSTCSWHPSAPVSGQTPATGYEYQLCRVLKYTYCFGPDGTTRTVQQYVTNQSSGAPVSLSPPSITGTAQQGSTLTGSPGSWSNNPTAYTYQWQDCGSSGGACANIAGATAQTYTLGSGDVGHTIVVAETAANSAGTGVAASPATAVVSQPVAGGNGDGTTGAVTFAENFQNPQLATGYDPQALNYPASGAKCNPFGTTQKCPGDWYTQPSGYFGVVNSADLWLPASSQCSCGYEYVAHSGRRASTNEVGTTTYHSMGFYVPSSCSIPNGYTEVQELHFTNLFNGAPIRFELYCNHVTIQLDTGVCVQGSHCAYHSNADAPNGTPRGAIKLPGLYAIPPGAITPGAWNEIVVRVDWETSSAGSVTSWFRSYNPTTGTHTTWQPAGATCSPSSAGPCGSLTGIPTPQWQSGGQPPTAWNDGPESYKYAGTASMDTYVAGYSDASGFAAAASSLP